MCYDAWALRHTQSALLVKGEKHFESIETHFFYYFGELKAQNVRDRYEREYATPDCDTSDSDLLVSKINWPFLKKNGGYGLEIGGKFYYKEEEIQVCENLIAESAGWSDTPVSNKD